MGFFEDRPRYHADGRARPRPELQAPRDHIPGIVPVAAPMLSHTDDTALAITHLRAYHEGFAFTLAVCLRSLDGPDLSGQAIWRTFWPGRWITFVLAQDARLDTRFTPGVVPDVLPPEVLLIGVQFPDGRKATNLDEWPPSAVRQIKGPVMTIEHYRATLAGGRYELGFWVRPLSPPGPLSIACEWPARRVESRMRLTTEVVSDASERSLALWLDE